MAISQENTITLETSTHDNLSTNINADDYVSAVGSQSSHTEGGVDIPFFGVNVGGTEVADSASGSAGIVADFEAQLHKVIDETYVATIKSYIDVVGENCESLVHPALSGTNIEKTVNGLIVALKNEVDAYAGWLKDAQQEIVTAVKAAYATHDENVAGEMSEDTAKLDAGAGQTQ